MSNISMTCFAASYAVALALEVTRLFFRSGVRGALMLGFAAAGLVAQTLFLVARVSEPNRTIPGWSDWYLLAAWVLAATYLYLTYYHPAFDGYRGRVDWVCRRHNVLNSGLSAETEAAATTTFSTSQFGVDAEGEWSLDYYLDDSARGWRTFRINNECAEPRPRSCLGDALERSRRLEQCTAAGLVDRLSNLQRHLSARSPGPKSRLPYCRQHVVSDFSVGHRTLWVISTRAKQSRHE